MKIWKTPPPCTGRWEYYQDGNEFVCDADDNVSCDDCLALYHHYGGRRNPDTGEIVPKIICLLKYGKSKMTVRKENERIDTM